MSWKPTPKPTRTEYPEGTDWRCRAEGCDFSEPKDARPDEVGCPKCGASRLYVVASTTTYFS